MTLLAAVLATLQRQGVPHRLIGEAAGPRAREAPVEPVGRFELLTADPAVLDSAFWSSFPERRAWLDIERHAEADAVAGVVRFFAVDDRPVSLAVVRRAPASST